MMFGPLLPIFKDLEMLMVAVVWEIKSTSFAAILKAEELIA